MKRLSLLLIGMSVGAMLVGCASETGSRIDGDYGTSYKLAKTGQILNPDAGMNLDPVRGIEGETSRRVIEGYRKSFEETPEGPTYTFKLGDTSGK